MQEYTLNGYTVVVDDGQIVGHLTHEQKKQMEAHDNRAKNERKYVLLRFVQENKDKIEELLNVS